MIVWLNGPHGVGKSSVAARAAVGWLLDRERSGGRQLRSHHDERSDD